MLASGLLEVFELGPNKAHACVQLVWSSCICTRCGGGGQMLMCDGTCLRSWHLSCLSLSALPSPDKPPEAWCAHVPHFPLLHSTNSYGKHMLGTADRDLLHTVEVSSGLSMPLWVTSAGGLVTCLAPQNCTANNKRCNVLSLWWLERWNS